MTFGSEQMDVLAMETTMTCLKPKLWKSLLGFEITQVYKEI